MKPYLLIIKGAGPKEGSPAQMQQALSAYQDWAMGLKDQYVDGQRLEDHGALVQNKNTVLTDGPFLEAKEIIAGYIIVNVDSLDAAIAIAQGCPLIGHCMIEVRPVLG